MSTLDHFELSIAFEHHFYHRKRKLIQTVFIIRLSYSRRLLKTPLFRRWVGPSLDYWRGFSVPQPVVNFLFHSTEPIPAALIAFHSDPTWLKL